MNLPLGNTQAPAEPEPDRHNPSTISADADAPALKKRRALCCVGVDEPGVGHVHASNCVLRGRAYTAGEMSDGLRAFLDGETDHFDSTAAEFARELSLLRQMEIGEPSSPQLPEARVARLMAQLLFATRDLAESRVHRGWSENVKSHCFECGGMPVGYTDVAHEPECKTGRVLRILADLCALPSVDLNRKETAPGGDLGRAGEGVRSPQPQGFPIDRTDAYDDAKGGAQ